ncbi:MAG: M20/M25/M40 family metallo-hydrolase [Planctomycetes bacterium]|nr:M20/M25/M40 family metallo-hydrolase [Planctomycetota bacterium]
MSAKRKTSIGRRILERLLSIPTAPFAEHQVIEHIDQFCAARKNISLTRDRAGNLLARVRVGRRTIKRPVCITAHLDHPGFVADRMVGKRLRAFWRGGVPRKYFVGSGVRFDVAGRWVKGRIRSVKTVNRDGQRRVDTAMIEVAAPVPARSIGMWDFGGPTVRGSRIHARACDDLAGAAAMLCAMDELARTRESCDAYFLFSRAEEVGFIGAIAACRLKTIPQKCFVVAMETSSERADAKMGDGPILRVGDRATTFTHEATAHCHRIARELERSDRRFKYQRKLMDGGTCESSAYCRLGYEATGLCVALGNYHNVDVKRRKLGMEYIDLDDFDNVVKWFVELGRALRPYTGRDVALDERLKQLESSYKSLLRSTVGRPR